MLQIFAPLMPEYTINIPQDPVALIAWVVWFGLLFFLILRSRQKGSLMNRNNLIWMAVLSLLILILTPFLGIPVNLDPGSHFDQSPALHLMFFAAVPWLVAGGILGVFPASLIAGVSGLLYAYLETHHIYTPLVFISMALVFTWSVRQRYRTTFYKFLRIPVFASLFTLITIAPLLFISELLTINDTFPMRIAIGLNRMPEMLVIYGGMLFVGGIVCILVAALFPGKWGSTARLSPSPGEKSLKISLLFRAVPILLVLLLLVFGLLWQVNVNTARRIIVDELVRTSELVSQGWSAFLNAGLITFEDLEESVLLSQNANLDISQTLSQGVHEDSFFDRITILSSQGEIITSHGKTSADDLYQVPEEIVNTSRLLANDEVQIMRASINSDDPKRTIHFLKIMPDETGQILWGYTNLSENRFSGTIMTAKRTLENNNGFGQIINKTGKVFFSSRTIESENLFTGATFSTPTFYETPTNDGSYLLRYYYPFSDGDWAVVSSAPAVVLFQNAWQNSWPIFLFGLGIFGIFTLFSVAGFSPILKDIKNISSDMEKLAKGSFDLNFSEATSRGEITQLFNQFQQLAGSLSNRFQRQADLISLNEQVSSKNNLQDSLNAIMEATLKGGADSVRIIVYDTLGMNQPVLMGKTFSLGNEKDLFAHLDQEIQTLVRAQGELIFYDYQVTRKLTQGNEQPYPSALLAFPMNWQNKDIGIFWAAYQEKSLTNEDIQYNRDLARKASIILAKANALGDAIGLKNHLENILDSIQDGILLLNENNRVIYHNLSAESILGQPSEQMIGSQITSMLKPPSVAEFIVTADQNVEPRDFTMDDGTICRVSVTNVEDTINGRIRAVIFRNITQSRKQALLKSEFVTTASHELRSPLTLIHGYAKLLRLAGNLNDQQETYINNIIEGVEDMKNLVQNLLDIGRLESGRTLEVNRTSASELSKKVFESMQPFAKQRNIHLDLALPDSPITLDADEIFLSQALKNLIENAIKFTKMGGDVTLAVRELEDNVVFSVKDTGIGIAPLDQRYLFEKFNHRGTPLGQESKGSGLGLAIVKSIAERHGGKVWFESQLAKGSTFYLEIPKKYGKNL